MPRLINPVPKFKPNSSLYFFKSGTNSQLTTFADISETIPNTHPVLTDAEGYAPNIFFSGSARFLAFDQYGVQYIERDPIGGELELGAFTAWDSQIVYDKNDIIESSGKFYQSFSSANQGNDPSASPSDWFEVRFLGVYNSSAAYNVGDVVQTSNGFLYRSLEASNTNNDPETTPASWLPAFDAQSVPEIQKLDWKYKSADFSAVNNESYLISATANTVDITLPTISQNHAFTFHNVSVSTQKVQILNPAYTIRGTSGEVTAGTDLELSAGDSVQVVAQSNSVLAIVGAQA